MQKKSGKFYYEFVGFYLIFNVPGYLKINLGLTEWKSKAGIYDFFTFLSL